MFLLLELRIARSLVRVFAFCQVDFFFFFFKISFLESLLLRESAGVGRLWFYLFSKFEGK